MISLLLQYKSERYTLGEYSSVSRPDITTNLWIFSLSIVYTIETKNYTLLLTAFFSETSHSRSIQHLSFSFL